MCPNKIFETFLIEDFFHLPPVSTAPVVSGRWQLWCTFRYSGAWGKLIHKKILSWTSRGIVHLHVNPSVAKFSTICNSKVGFGTRFLRYLLTIQNLTLFVDTQVRVSGSEPSTVLPEIQWYTLLATKITGRFVEKIPGYATIGNTTLTKKGVEEGCLTSVRPSTSVAGRSSPGW
jgi:hypothetical protein